VLFAVIAVLIAADAGLDVVEGADAGHLVFEGVVIVLACGGLLLLWAQILRSGRKARALEGRLLRARADADHWRHASEALQRGLGEAIDRQFREWGLSAAEREVGLLLLKGLSLKEIAELRGTSERTVRQQALAIYRKGEVAGRAELTAFFLEDLLVPHDEKWGQAAFRPEK
jgi:DNA-binding CsgD family transcriptional regulator